MGHCLEQSTQSADCVIVRSSEATGRTVRVLDNGWIDANGENGPHAQWRVHHRGGHLLLQNIHNGLFVTRSPRASPCMLNARSYLAIRDGQLTTGQGGEWCAAPR